MSLKHRVLGIDASNIRGGGTINHLVELLAAAEPSAHGFSQVVVWSGRRTLDRIEDRPWLVKRHQSTLDQGLVQRTSWQRSRLSGEARAAGCEVLFVPGGSFAGDFRPMVTMSQNLLPFERRELRRFGWSRMLLKLLLLRWTNSRTFRRADGLIFLTAYARNAVMRVIRTTTAKTRIIPLGISPRFRCPPRQQRSIRDYSAQSPFRMVYVSTVDMYKHHPEVVEAVATLAAEGIPVVLDIVGAAYPPALDRLRNTIARYNADTAVRYMGEVPHHQLAAIYGAADLCLFASSCENMPNILLEGMAAGLPIACSNRGPMPDLLGEGGLYFDPERSDDITRTIRMFIDSPQLRAEKAQMAFDRSQMYSWERCAHHTFELLAEIGSPT